MDAGRRVDAAIHSAPELALALAPVTVGVLAGLRDRLLGDAETLLRAP